VAAEGIGPGSRVTLHYRLALADGTPVDDSGDEPLVFVVGDGTLIPGLEDYLMGLGPGERVDAMLPPAAAFGPREPGNEGTLARSDFPPAMDLAPGTVVALALPSGEEAAGTVLAVEEEQVRVDFNHPLAGHTIRFAAEVLAVDHPRQPTS
jgi:FKBP-type peptidyl-prolyl cis-trans isomerase SlpA